MATPLFTSSAPKFHERGVTLSASTVKYSEEWMRVLLSQMSTMRLNTLLWEVKISYGPDPADATGSAGTFMVTSEPYVTPEEATRILAFAHECGISVIPEINSPGHLRTWLTHYPQYAIIDSTGTPDLERLDASNPEAVQWYLDLVDSYAQVFSSDQWHMGADEFENELDHRTYADYPHLVDAAREAFGVDAKPWDINAAFVNTVAKHVQAQGKTLRIWNDGIRKGGVVELDPRIVVEYWIDKGEHYKNPQELADHGHMLINVPQYLYFSRSEKHIYDPQPQAIYEGAHQYFAMLDGDQTVCAPDAVQGVRLSLWPDKAEAQTPAEVLAEARDILILTGQIAWDGLPPQPSWAAFKEYADSLDLAPIPEDTCDKISACSNEGAASVSASLSCGKGGGNE